MGILCDGCGKCCLHKIEDEVSGAIHPTNVACRLLDRHSCRCSSYRTRRAFVPDCIRLSAANVERFQWLPSTCAYRLRAEGKPLPEWHPLLPVIPNRCMRPAFGTGWTVSETDAAISIIIWSIVSSELRLPCGTALTLKISPRAKVMRLRVDQRTGTVLLTVPRRCSERRAIDWAAGQRQWIEAALADLAPAVTIGAGASVPLYGKPHVVDGIRSGRGGSSSATADGSAGGPADGSRARVLRWLRSHAATCSRRERMCAARAGGAPPGRCGRSLSRWGSARLGRDPLQLAAILAPISSAARRSRTRSPISST